MLHGRWLVFVGCLVFGLFISTRWLSAAGAPDCQSPFPVISALPYTDTGDTTQATTNTINLYPPSGSLDPYGANEYIYEISLGPTNFISITLEGISNQTDHAIFVLRSCGDGMSLESFSQDTVDDIQAEHISARTYPSGTYYITIDGWSGAPGYPATGPYTLTVNGNLGFDGTPAPTSTPTPTLIPTPTNVPTITPSPIPTLTFTPTPMLVTKTPQPTQFQAFLPLVRRPTEPVQDR